MARSRLFTVYALSVAIAGLGLALLLTVLQAPHDVHSWTDEVLVRAAILAVLTFLSSISPLKTRTGAVVTVGMAPLFGALLILPTWAVMWVAAIATVDERLLKKQVTWKSFLFARGMFALVYGIPSLVLAAMGLAPMLKAPPPIWYGLQPVAVLAIVALNLGLVAVFFALYNGSNMWELVKHSFTGTWLTYIALPVLGYLIYVFLLNQGAVQLVVFLLYGPLLVYRASLQKQHRLDQWLRDSFIMQSRVVDKRDGQTFGHSQRVGELSETVARLLHLNEEQCNVIRVGGILHDLGKIAIPDSILLKPGKLTPEEYEIIKTHPVEGAAILAEHPEQKDVSDIVMHHHERWDGAGYPDGIKGEEIPLGSRIVNACDAFDTITQARVFRPTVKTPAEAIRELRQLAGTWYDPAVITALEKIVAERWGVEIPPTSPPSPVAPKYGDVLAIRRFRRLWLGQGVSYFGDMMNTTGLAIMLFVLTRSPGVVALGLIAKAVPVIAFGLVAGPIVDRFDRQRVMIIADLIRALLTVTIPFFALQWLPGVFIAVGLIATASTFFNPAKQAILPNLVPPEQLVKANSLITSSERVSELLGYSVAGIIAAAVSWAPLFLIDAATYIFSAITLLGVTDALRSVGKKHLRIVDDIVAGMRFIATSPTLRSTMTLTTMAALFMGLTFPTLVVLAYGALGAGASGYGFLEAAIGAGAVIGALLAPQLMNRYRAGLLILLGVAGFGASYAFTGLVISFPLALMFLFLGGAANTAYLVPLISVTQREAPDYIRGRVMSSRFLLAQTGLLGGIALAGPLSDRLGAPLVFVAAGFLLICAALVGFAFKNLRNASLRDIPSAPVLKAVSG
ncbi:MAG TPA: MFS transporter [Candidatus Dormibacteraeota bacterium]|nr:MFS transporter [Candidatus Dormibacteraeota bacterium]